jgi:hypothetical protein
MHDCTSHVFVASRFAWPFFEPAGVCRVSFRVVIPPPPPSLVECCRSAGNICQLLFQVMSVAQDKRKENMRFRQGHVLVVLPCETKIGQRAITNSATWCATSVGRMSRRLLNLVAVELSTWTALICKSRTAHSTQSSIPSEIKSYPRGAELFCKFIFDTNVEYIVTDIQQSAHTLIGISSAFDKRITATVGTAIHRQLACRCCRWGPKRRHIIDHRQSMARDSHRIR